MIREAMFPDFLKKFKTEHRLDLILLVLKISNLKELDIKCMENIFDQTLIEGTNVAPVKTSEVAETLIKQNRTKVSSNFVNVILYKCLENDLEDKAKFFLDYDFDNRETMYLTDLINYCILNKKLVLAQSIVDRLDSTDYRFNGIFYSRRFCNKKRCV